ncbi:sensor histidine kinase [Colwellia psychrerythraea]|uniref:histidine kinase n=1 Tax=Colwellia psychrerythraea TaxID=28229 RepID=A0A099KDW4_COLPS|nr:ATP-binding protein [Colwellia psychrerythraea]KGJ88202.1 integral membrane sensor signal transduction histidine kinase [Colwellia psychrerythraea]
MRTLKSSLIVVAVVATLGLGWLFDQVYAQYSPENSSPDALDVLRQLGENLAKMADKSPSSKALLSNWPNIKQYSLKLQPANESPLPQSLLEQMKRGEAVLLETSKNLSYHYFLPIKDEILILRSPLLNKGANAATHYLWSAAFYLVLISILLLWAYPLVKQLLALRAAARAFGEGKLDNRISLSSISYIHDIEVEFNNMAQRIENLIADVKLLSTAVSHDLRTPLARIRFGIDTLQEVEDLTLRQELELQLGDDVDEMTSLVETLLNYARLEQNRVEIQKEPVNLSELIQTCIKRKKSNNFKLSFINKSSNKLVLVDNKYITMVLNNLLQNAINYGRGHVLVELFHNSHNTIISISDDGDGVPIEQRENIIKPFFRAKNSLNQVKGHGIGLAIVKRILDWHNGTLSISNATELSGSKFTIKLPSQH